ncbi:MAG: hypothetical protein IJ309_02450 [Clostridia bacterium]|nr:hypothetical protein [Clostridia bacterium]
MNVFITGTEDTGSSYSSSLAITNFDFIQILNFDVDRVSFAFKNLWSAMLLESNFKMYSFYFMYYGTLGFLFVLLAIIFVLVAWVIFQMLVYDYTENPYEDTRALSFWKRRVVPPYRYIVQKLVSFIRRFVSSHYFKAFVIIWLFNLNILTIAVELVAWLFYILTNPVLDNFMTTLSTVFLDVFVMFNSAPLIFWLVIAAVIFNHFRKKAGVDNLYHLYNYCMGFGKSLANNVIIEGPTGANKSKIAVQMTLLKEDQFHTDQLESINKFHVWFPDFPFEYLEAEVDAEMEEHLIYSKHTCMSFVQVKKSEYDMCPCSQAVWGYEGPMEYNDGFKYVTLWEMLQEYVYIYYMYTNDTTSIMASISVRSDLHKYPGWFARWNNNLVQRCPEEFDDITRYCHINDYDTVRYSKQIDPNNEHIGAVDYAIRLDDELDKDRGNQFTNKQFDASDATPNPLNDGFNKHLMMSRHEASADYKSYSAHFATMQRSNNYKADEKDLFDLHNIISKDDLKLAIPMFIEFPLLKKIVDWYYGFNEEMKGYGKRRTLPYYLLTHLTNPFINYMFRIINQYGYERVVLAQRKACNQDEVLQHEYFIIYCIAHNYRYRSDGFSAVNDEVQKSCKKGLVDIPCYEGPLAMTHEYPEMKSFFADSLLDRMNDRKK